MTDDAPLQREPQMLAFGKWSLAQLDEARRIAVETMRTYGDLTGDEYERFLKNPWNDHCAVQAALRAMPPGEPALKTITCPTCDGRGDIGPRKSAEGDMLDQPCPQCEGWGYITPTGYIAYLVEDRNNSNRLLDECRHERNVLQKICAERSDEIERLPAPKAEASDLERARQVVLDLTGRDPGEESAWGRVVATALAAVRREATSAERERCATIADQSAKDAVHERETSRDQDSKACWLWAHDEAVQIARDIRAANKPPDITLARDPGVGELGAVDRVGKAIAKEFDSATFDRWEEDGSHRSIRVARDMCRRMARAAIAASPAHDPIALLLAEAARLARSDDLEDQRRARGLQDAAELLGEKSGG